jgi:hypothetical protein
MSPPDPVPPESLDPLELHADTTRANALTTASQTGTRVNTGLDRPCIRCVITAAVPFSRRVAGAARSRRIAGLALATTHASSSGPHSVVHTSSYSQEYSFIRGADRFDRGIRLPKARICGPVRSEDRVFASAAAKSVPRGRQQDVAIVSFPGLARPSRPSFRRSRGASGRPARPGRPPDRGVVSRERQPCRCRPNAKAGPTQRDRTRRSVRA